MSDAQLREAVLKELQAETGLDASQVSVDVRHGMVRSWHERRLIEEAVWAAPGVTAVEDHIRVR